MAEAISENRSRDLWSEVRRIKGRNKFLSSSVDGVVGVLVLRLLLYMYTKQKLQVRWGCSISSQFTACNGVKQGAILSPILFSVYMDGLFEKLEKSGVGCHMGNHYTGGIGYADELTLHTPTRSGLKVLNEICEQYADDYCVKFNRAKSMYLVFRGRSCKKDNRTVVFNGTELHCV